jgi:hypothetical protein
LIGALLHLARDCFYMLQNVGDIDAPRYGSKPVRSIPRSAGVV